jgi:hypothetical protein
MTEFNKLEKVKDVYEKDNEELMKKVEELGY